MAKKLLATNYRINSDSDKVVIKGFYRAEQIQLITDVTPETGGTIMYNFADTSKGHKGVEFDTFTEETTIFLEFDMGAYGIDSTSDIQIIVDHPEMEIEVSDSLLDPVHKIRVSTPENLIDTDFEYGLQPTKWETLELSNNVPSFFVADGDTALDIIDTITSVSGSDVIKVACTDAHNLVVGTPIDVAGLDFRTAEGKFLILEADSNNFFYRANAPQTVTGEIGSLYSAITPGSFYAGSQIPYSQDSGLETDELDPSTITVNTPDVHGFVDGSQFYLVNTIASKSLKVEDNKTAPDGDPFIDKRDTFQRSLSLDLSKTKTNAIRGRYSRFFSASDVDVPNNRITWPDHNLNTNYTLLYVPPAGAAQIGGLDRFDIYYVRRVDANTIELASSYNGSAINFSSAGDTSTGQHSLHLIYELRYSSKSYRNSYTYHYTWGYWYGSPLYSGYDMRQYSQSDPNTGATFYGLGSKKEDGLMVMTRNYSYPYNYNRWLDYYRPEYQNSRNIYGGNHYIYTDFPEYDNTVPTNHPSRWNPIEDFGRWRNYSWNSYTTTYSSGYFRFQTYYYHGSYNYYWSNRRVFIFPFIYDEEADTLFAENHGLSAGDTVTFTTKSGDAPTVNTGSYMGHTVGNSTLGDGDYTVDVVSQDRFKLSGQRIATAVGDSDNAYEIVGNVANPNANSFFVQSHGLIDGKSMRVGAVGSPTLPSVPTGSVTPRWKLSSQGNATLLANIANDAINDHIQNHSDFSAHKNFITSNHNGNSSRLTEGAGTSSNGMSYINLQYSNSNYLQVVKGGSSVYSNSNYNYSDVYLGRFDLNTPKNIFDTVSGAKGFGIFRLATPWQRYTSIPYYVDFTFGGDAAHGSQDGQFSSSNYWRHYNYTYMGHRYNYVYTDYYSNDYDGSFTGPTSGDLWRYSFAHTYVDYGDSFTQITVTFGKATPNKGWSGYSTNGSGLYGYSYRYNSRSSYSYLADFSYKQDEVNMRLFFAGSSSLNIVSSDIVRLIERILTDIDAEFINPTFTLNDTVTANVISNDRFSVSNGGALIDLTDSGGGFDSANFLKFSIDDVQGAADGSFVAESVGERFIKLDTPFLIEGNTEVIKADSADSGVMQIVGGHNFLSGTKVVYNTTEDSALTGLTDGGEFFVNAIDDVYFSLHSNSLDALAGNDPIVTSTDSANSNHTISTTSIAGRSLANGTIITTENSKKIVGNQTLFKRFFKSGDTIFIKNDSATPGRLDEHQIAVISDDENMELTEPVSFSKSDAPHFVKTNIYAKPDGYSVHRPFDGGVEIGAGLAPLSQITRQTRKYFRYQSGKGIQTSLAINFNPPVILETITANGTTVRCRTKYPHRLSVGMQLTIEGASDADYNGVQSVASVVDDYNFTYTASAAPNQSIPSGIVQYVVNGYSGSFVRSGMFDNQNGFFFEWDGAVLNCVRRSSTTQLSGTVAANKNSGLITGVNTNFTGQLVKGDKVVIRGQTYKIVKIESRTEMFVQPQYRGVSSDGIILTKTIDVRVPQDDWNIDKADGSGKQGFILDTSKIQMGYMDYSWYGAGKIRFGFKDRKGHVRYVHEFIHNNRLDEAYMRSGNLPAKYEIENNENPTYAPTLFHWGTSIIMDGTFDDDKAYLFTAPSKNLTFTNGQSNTANLNSNSSLSYRYNRGTRQYDFYVRLPFNSNDASKFSTGTKLYTSNNELNGEEVAYTDYSGSTFRVHIYISSGYSFPPSGSYPVVTSGTTVNIGAASGGDATVNLGTDIVPLVSLRLAPSVDNNLTGDLGERDIINRMQLKLSEVGMILTHDCEVKLILNGDISTVSWENVRSPSLSQLIKHESGDQITGGNEVFSFRSSGGVDGSSATSNFSLGDLVDMGNSILGGNGIFPNGPDILTVAVQVVDTSKITANQPFTASSRITWSESQA